MVAEEDTLTLEIDKDAIAEVLEDRLPILQYLLRELNRQALGLLRRHRLDPSGFFPEPPADLAALGRARPRRPLAASAPHAGLRRSSVTALAELARTLASVRFEPGTVLWHEGEPSHGILLVSSGASRPRARAA